MKYALLFLLLNAYSISSLYAQSEFLDSTFGTNGVVLANHERVGAEFVQTLQVQADGKIILYGLDLDSGGLRVVLGRYHNNGVPDLTFGSEGFVQTFFSRKHTGDYSSQYELGDMVLLDSGKILVAGYSGEDKQLFLARYSSNGQLDDTFGSDGITYPFDELQLRPSDIAVQKDGSVIVCGVSKDGVIADGFLARFKPDGTPDSSFGRDGIVLSASVSQECSLYGFISLALDSEGRILVNGFDDYNAAVDSYKLVVAAFDSSGNIDTSFGVNGCSLKLVTTLRSISVGDILLSGNYIVMTVGSEQEYATVRLTQGGERDQTFGINGYQVWRDRVITLPRINAGPDGSLFLSGSIVGDGGSYDFFLGRYLADGSIDSQFGRNGEIVIDVNKSENRDFPLGVVSQLDGKIIQFGTSYRSVKGDLTLVRYNAQELVSSVEGETELFGTIETSVVGNSIDLSFTSTTRTTVDLRLYTLDGRELEQFTYPDILPGRQSLQIDLPEELPNGLYLLALSVGREKVEGVKVRVER
ncbi:MAG: hypothetical protein R3F28_08055 [Candidatus Kapaibacterium sp.]